MNIGILITARLKSSRLKRKILLDMHYKTVLELIIQRAKKIKIANKVVLCTSTNSQDSELEIYAKNNEIDIFKGSEDDVLDRLLKAAEFFKIDAFISITADNPLFSVQISSLMIEIFERNNHDFIYTKGIPIGIGPYLLKTNAIKIANFIKNQTDTEIWGPYINQPDMFNVGELHIKDFLDETKRLTLDYIEDYKLIKKIYSYFPRNYLPEINDLKQLLTINSDFFKINSHKKQASVDSEIIDVINKNFNSQKNSALKFAKEIGFKLKPGLSKKAINIKNLPL